MSDISTGPTQKIFEYLGLFKDGQRVYKRYVDLNGNDEEEDNEIIDVNYDRQITDQEAWNYIARNCSKPLIKLFIDSVLGPAIVSEIKYGKNDEAEETIDHIAMAVVTEESLDFSSVLQKAADKASGKTIVLPVPKPISPHPEVKETESDFSFLDLFTLELELGMFFHLGKGSLADARLPYTQYHTYLPVYDSSAGERVDLFEEGVPFGLGVMSKIYFYSILGVGGGIEGGGSAPGDENEPIKGMAQEGYQWLGPVLELRLPLFSFSDRDVQFAFFGRFSKAWGSNTVMAGRSVPEEYNLSDRYTIARLRRDKLYDFGLQFLFAEVFAVKFFGRYSTPELEGNPDIHRYSFPKWTFGFTLLDFFINQGGKKSIFNF